MGLADHTRLFLQEEGINTVEDLVDFTEDKIWLQFIENYNSYRHVETVGIGNLIPREPFRIAVKLLMRLRVTAVLISYY